MCGICGFNWSDKSLLKSMTDILYHRGPDEEGYYTDNKISFGVRRLKIIDLYTGKQPIYNEDKSICVIFNGEIYNYKQLREDLEKKGHKFYTNTDTEVIIHAYEESKEGCLNKFNGMFGLALWDSNEKKLFLAVDRLGIKPLYYTLIDQKFLFASEIKSLLQYDEVKREVNKKALIDYLTFRYTPSNQTIFNGIKKLSPGHFLVFYNNEIQEKKYWDLDIGTISDKSRDWYAKMILKHLEESVNLQMASDVPLGVYLSGGLDSSIIVALAKRASDSEIQTFSIGFEDEQFNEIKYSRLLAEHYSTNHNELIIKSDLINYLPRVIWHLDDIDSDPTLLAQYLLSEFAKKKVKVVLAGEGADELFGGYDEFKFLTFAEKYAKYTPRMLRKSLVTGMKVIPDKVLDNFFQFTSSLGEKGKERLSAFMDSLNNKEKSYMLLTSFFSDNEKQELYSDMLYQFEKENADYEKQISPYFKDTKRSNILNKLMYLDIKRRLPYHLLHTLDKTAMAHSVESRTPFLDHNLVEFSFTIPTNLKIKCLEQKYILKKAVSKLIPKEILKRKKHPFVAPGYILFKDNIKDIMERVFLKSKTANGEYFKYNQVKKIIQRYDKSKLYYDRQLWSLLSFDVWYKIYIENDNMKKPQLNFDKLYS